MRKINFIICLTLFFVFANAQELQDKYTIGILPVTASDYSNDSYKASIYAIITNVFTGKSRFTVVDRAKLDQIAKERNLQKQEDFIDGFIVEQGKSLGAQYLVSGNVTQISTTGYNKQLSKSVKNPNTGVWEKKYYQAYFTQATLSLNMQVIEVATGSVKSSKIITISKEAETTDQRYVINATIAATEGYVRGWANEVFPVEMKVMKVESLDKKGMPKTILIKGGADMDMQHSRAFLTNSSSELEIYENEVMVVDDKEYTRQITIGKITIAETQGEFSVCKIKSGAEAIQKKLNEGKTLRCKIVSYH